MHENDYIKGYFKGGKRLNIKEIAQEAQVSVASVSRYFNNRLLLSPQTAQRIEQAVKRHGYIPNSLGRSLRMARSGKLLALLPTISNPVYGKALRAMGAAAASYGYQVLTCATENEPVQERMLLQMLPNHYADGAVLFSSVLPARELENLSRRFLLVRCMEYTQGEGISTVSIDNEAAAFEAVEYLVRLGHRRIGMISGESSFTSTKLREAGYRRALEKNGIPFVNDLVMRGHYGFGSGRRAARMLLEKPNPPSALFAVSDALAAGAVREGAAMGLIPGKAFSVIGFDNTSLAAEYMPSLTTVHQPREEMGREAFRLFFERLNTPRAQPAFITLPHKLIIRESACE